MSYPTRLGHILRRSVDRGVHIGARAIYALPTAKLWLRGVSAERDIPYRERVGQSNRAHLLDVYRPLDGGPHPAVLYAHGGGFAMLSKDTHQVMAVEYASRGYVVFNINYRLGPKHRYPAPLEDAAAALLWMADHAHEYGADPTRIILAGDSAGANLVTALTIAATQTRPEPFARAIYDRALPIRAVLPLYGMFDMFTLARLADNPKFSAFVKMEIASAGYYYLGHPLAETAARAPLASPLLILAEPPGEGSRPLPPFFLAVGTADPLLDDSRRLKAALDRRGVPCELSVYPGELHGFNAMVWSKAARAKWKALHAFLKEHVRS